MSGAPLVRLGAALSGALDRKAVRDSCGRDLGFDLAVASSTANGLMTRHENAPLDYLIIEVGLADAESTVHALVERGDTAKILLIAPDPVVTARKYNLRSRQVITPVSQDLGEHVIARIRGLTPEVVAPIASAETPITDPTTFKRRELVVIGCSTGGPDALPVVLNALPASFPVPIIVVQHMPPNFTGLFAQRLDRDSPLTVREVTGPVQAKKGEVWLAPGDRHVVITDTAGSLALDDGPEVKNCRPSVDVLFHSAARVYGRRVVGAVLTGMGDDGCDGARALDAAGAHLIAQDEATSVVWGMPGALTKAGLADSVLPLREVAGEIRGQFRTATLGAGAL